MKSKSQRLNRQRHTLLQKEFPGHVNFVVFRLKKKHTLKNSKKESPNTFMNNQSYSICLVLENLNSGVLV